MNSTRFYSTVALNAYVTWLTVESNEKLGFKLKAPSDNNRTREDCCSSQPMQLLLLDGMTSKHHHRSFMDEG